MTYFAKSIRKSILTVDLILDPSFTNLFTCMDKIGGEIARSNFFLI